MVELIEFNVDLSRNYLHYFDITMHFSAYQTDPIIEFPSWTPGSYLIREYVRHVAQLQAFVDEQAVSAIKQKKNRWIISAAKGAEITIKYSVYAYDLTVRTNYIDSRFGLLNGAATFFYPCSSNAAVEPLLDIPIHVHLTLPEDLQAFSPLTAIESNVYKANNFDELYDSPFGFGMPDVVDTTAYKIDNVSSQVVIIGERGNQDIEKFALDLQKIQEYGIKMFGELPYDHYLWLLYIVEVGGGGLEHKFCNVSIANRWAFADEKTYKNILRLESHEHFHVYNVKRIRPKSLGPFDYANEVYTSMLWVAEGMTVFYEKNFLLRAGLISIDDYLKWVEDAINAYLKIPGRFVQSLAQSSFDAWIKLYRADENTVNSTISYYLKGGLVAFLLDIEIRKQTNNTKSLDDIFRHLYEDFKQNPEEGYPEDDEFRVLIEKIAKVDLKIFFENYITGTKELPLADYLQWLGILLIEKSDQKRVLHGIVFEKQSNKIKSVLLDSAFSNAGISAHDELIAINAYRYKESTISKLLATFQPGDPIYVLVFRDDAVLEFEVPYELSITEYVLQKIEHPSEEILQRLQSFSL